MNTRKIQTFQEASTYARNLAVSTSRTTNLLRAGSGWSVSIYYSKTKNPVIRPNSTPIKSNPPPITFSSHNKRPHSYTFHQKINNYEAYKDEEDEEEEEIDIKDYNDRINEEYEEKASHMENYARSENGGWYYSYSDGSWEDNLSDENY